MVIPSKSSKIYTMYQGAPKAPCYVRCILNVAGTAFKVFPFLTLMCTQIPLSLYDFKKVIKVFVSLYYDCTIFYAMKNISRTSELPVRTGGFLYSLSMDSLGS